MMCNVFKLHLDCNFKFDKHVPNTFSKANRKLSALTVVAKLFPFKEGVFFLKHLQSLNLKLSIRMDVYCPLEWMFHRRQISDKINKLQL